MLGDGDLTILTGGILTSFPDFGAEATKRDINRRAKWRVSASICSPIPGQQVFLSMAQNMETPAQAMNKNKIPT